MNKTILIVDDEEDIVGFMKDFLKDQGYDVITAYNSNQALEALVHKLDLVILDVMMPGMNGFELCEMMRKSISCPIIFLSAKASEADRIKGLVVGGDDYLVKPFSMKELHVRIIAHLRREHRQHGLKRKHLNFGHLMIDVDGHEIYYQNQEIFFTTKEFDIIEFLTLHPGQVFSREQIYEKLWGYEAEGDSATVTEHVKNIRAKLVKYEPNQSYISTVWGVGYKWGK